MTVTSSFVITNLMLKLWSVVTSSEANFAGSKCNRWTDENASPCMGSTHVIHQVMLVCKSLANRNRTSDRWMSMGWGISHVEVPDIYLQSTALPTELSRDTTTVRFELTRSMSNGLAIHRLNHSATLSWWKLFSQPNITFIFKIINFHAHVFYRDYWGRWL